MLLQRTGSNPAPDQATFLRKFSSLRLTSVSCTSSDTCVCFFCSYLAAPQTSVGTVIKCSNDDDPLAITTALNTHTHRAAAFMPQIRAFIASKCKGDAKEQILKVSVACVTYRDATSDSVDVCAKQGCMQYVRLAILHSVTLRHRCCCSSLVPE